MKKQNFFQFLLLLISTLVFSQEKEIEFLIPSIQSDITIDGVGNEKEWGKVIGNQNFGYGDQMIA